MRNRINHDNLLLYLARGNRKGRGFQPQVVDFVLDWVIFPAVLYAQFDSAIHSQANEGALSLDGTAVCIAVFSSPLLPESIDKFFSLSSSKITGVSVVAGNIHYYLAHNDSVWKQ
jgi:hypothetical protein